MFFFQRNKLTEESVAQLKTAVYYSSVLNLAIATGTEVTCRHDRMLCPDGGRFKLVTKSNLIFGSLATWSWVISIIFHSIKYLLIEAQKNNDTWRSLHVFHYLGTHIYPRYLCDTTMSHSVNVVEIGNISL